ncbi:peptidase M50 [Pilimelia anulata]|uniref:Zinc metalloprotease n=1 Tax=Pilimelia anulata TaxID=53371 RepID=A0A8J3BEQ8_9ACTN|nr:site-2 protease family protein [Pilimelia anulata]GGK02010.1 peptidase M50 [Pilimelia anulata]
MTAVPPPTAPGDARRPGIPLGRLAGAPVRLQPSALAFAGLVALAYGPVVTVSGGHDTGVGYVIAGCFVVLLFLSVLLHELGHALVARHHGIGVRGITLELLGGYTELDRPAPRPGVELSVAAAGPVVSLLLGAVASLVATLIPATGTNLDIVDTVVGQVAASNLIVGVFNSLPGLPLDGGRMLAAALWRGTGDRRRGILVAGWIGRGLALATAVAALLLFQLGFHSFFGLAFALLLVMTLWQGAGQAIRAARGPVGEGLAALAAPLATVPAGTSLADAQRQLADSGHPDAVLAVLDPEGRVSAIVDEAAAAAVPAERRPGLDVAAVARALSAMPALPDHLPPAELRRAVASNPAALYLVTSGEDVCGVLRAATLSDWLDSQRK